MRSSRSGDLFGDVTRAGARSAVAVHEAVDEGRYLGGFLVEGEMAGVENVNLGGGKVLRVG
jgi:hypothetical protein